MRFKNILFFALYTCLIYSCNQQAKKEPASKASVDTSSSMNVYVKSDLSELDISWCPANYPMEHMQGDTTLKLRARVIYSRPHKNGRQIFGSNPESLCMYGKPWRLGANEATELTFFEDVMIAGKLINKGTYVIYCIPAAENWTIILNTNLYTWGLHIDESKDVFKTVIPITLQSPTVEDFTIFFANTATGSDLTMVWDNVKAVLPIQFAN